MIFQTQATSEENEKISAVFERNVSLACNYMPRVYEMNYKSFSGIRESTVKRVLGNSFSISMIYQRIGAVAEDHLSKTTYPHRPSFRNGALRERFSLATISEQDESVCVVLMHEPEIIDAQPLFNPARYFDRWVQLAGFSSGSSEEKASFFLMQKIALSELMSKELYLELNCIINEGQQAPFRKDKKTSYCLSSALIQESSAAMQSTDFDMQKDGFGSVEFLRYTFDFFSVHKLYELKHLPFFVKERFEDVIYEFNIFMEMASSVKTENVSSVRLRAIVYLFMRLEQLQPVVGCERTNFILLNYLLAKFGLPPSFFKQREVCCGDRTSVFSLVSFDALIMQIKEGMAAWCRLSGSHYPF